MERSSLLLPWSSKPASVTMHGMLDGAAAARAKADLALSDANLSYDRALSESSADRENDALVAAAARTSVRSRPERSVT